ncbi:MAG: hypothetical protein IJH64_13900 [Oscillospiraceae bacterium]|nr:hypothetical protein [Oscillospiraceae bacterium]MBR0451088.1 hypothetical protein [Oscillospiraceae bacterium]
MIQLQCRECGNYNRNLLLSESSGGFECCCCGAINYIIGWRDNCFPVVRSESERNSVSDCRRAAVREAFLERIQHVPKGYYAY